MELRYVPISRNRSLYEARYHCTKPAADYISWEIYNKEQV